MHEVPEQLTRRGQPTGDEVPHQRAQLAAGEWLAVDRECEQLGEHVIGRLAGGELGGALVEARVDVTGELGERRREADTALGLVRRGE